MTEKSFLEILSEKIEKQLRQEFSQGTSSSNFQTDVKSQNEKTTQNVDNSFSPNQSELREDLDDQALNNHHYQQWMSQIPLGKIHFQTPRNRVFGKVYPQNTPRPKPVPPRIKHALTEQQKQSIVYFWGWQVRLPEDYTQNELKKAFRTLAQRLHPDRNNGKVEDFMKLKSSYECLLSVF